MEEMEKCSIVRNYVPPDYGRVKRALFRLGLKAYQHPRPLGWVLYNGLANLVGVPLWLIIPGYEFGGIRQEIKRGREQRPLEFDPNGIYEPEEIKGLFRFTGEKNTDPRLLRLAIKHLDHYRGNASKSLFVFLSGFSVVGLFSFFAIQSLLEDYNLQRAALFGIAAGISLRSFLQIAAQIRRASKTLLNFILNTDQEILVNYLPIFRISFRVKKLLRRTFWDELSKEVKTKGYPLPNGSYYDQILKAVDSMKLSDWEEEEWRPW